MDENKFNSTVFTPTGQHSDHVYNLFSQWVVAKSEWYHLAKTCPDLDSPEIMVAHKQASDLFSQIADTTAQSLDGLNCLARILWEECGPTMTGADQEEQSYPELRLMRQILVSAENLACVPAWQPLGEEMIPAGAF